MERRMLIVRVLLALLVLAPAQAIAQRTNVLLIIADDLRNDLGCYGVRSVRSPQP